jgi:glutathione synthase/RimK-type ligase-like ATP-grasp enzyme
MPTLIVVESQAHWPFDIPGSEVVTAQDYLAAPRFIAMKRARVYNMCRSNGYQTVGYYVSLLAAARGHRPLPSVSTIQDLKLTSVVNVVAADLGASVQKLLRPIKTERFELSVYFGRNLARRYDRLSQQLFNRLPAPLLRAEFRRADAGWKLTGVRSISPVEIPEAHHDFVLEQARRYFARPKLKSQKAPRFDLAVLVDPDEVDAPSDAPALARLERVANKLDVQVTFIGKDDIGRIAEFDALFIRATTAVNHYTYRFARKAATEGLAVIDDPESIVKCTNKVYQAELFRRHGIPSPKTLVVHRKNAAEVEAEFGLPCVVKQPDSAFSAGVFKADTSEELKDVLARMLEKSELAVAQEYLPSSFDWRVGILDGRALFVCRYYMARGHWQIQRANNSGGRQYGRSETLPVEQAPSEVVELALNAAGLIGSSLYGVDIKEVDGQLLVMEVNDNPSIEAGCEDACLKEELYESIISSFIRRIEQRGSASVPGIST